MGKVSDRLRELGITLPPAPQAVASYVPARRTGDLIWTSGQLPFRDGVLTAKGAVGSAVTLEDAEAAARQAALNAVAVAAELAGGVDYLDAVIKVVGFVQGPADFHAQPQVVNGASNLLQDIFGDEGRHARSAVGVAALPLDAPVEVEVVFHTTAPGRS